MRFSLNSKNLLNKAQKYAWPVVGLATVSTFLLGISRPVYSPIVRKINVKGDKIIAQGKSTKPTAPSSKQPATSGSSHSATSATSQVEAVQTPSFTHSNIITTYFWVGEKADPDNNFIANKASAWDEKWEQHYGGEDTPNARNGYNPAAFVPKENPFYFALPYSDIDDNGNRKASATNCPNYPAMKDQPYSWCKNAWIAIRANGKVAYAQWQDVGPYQEDDAAYVFGSAAPKNQLDVKAGLDVSPAVHDYLGLGDVSNCDWGFVPASSIPSGPWTQTITTDLGDSI